jgi:protein-disulfide isomerase
MRFLALGVLLLLAFALFGCAGTAPINEGMTSGGRAYRGADSPKVVIYEYSDFQCPFCSKAQPTIEEVLSSYPNNVQLQFRYYPLTDIHPQSYGAALAGVCAEEQGKFWKMHDLMFSNQGALFDADLQKYAGEAGMNTTKFEKCVASPEAAAKVKADQAEAATIGVQATPTFKIGGSEVKGSQPFSTFKSVIDSELARAG